MTHHHTEASLRLAHARLELIKEWTHQLEFQTQTLKPVPAITREQVASTLQVFLAHKEAS